MGYTESVNAIENTKNILLYHEDTVQYKTYWNNTKYRKTGKVIMYNQLSTDREAPGYYKGGRTHLLAETSITGKDQTKLKNKPLVFKNFEFSHKFDGQFEVDKIEMTRRSVSERPRQGIRS